jgi:hypothetical protein
MDSTQRAKPDLKDLVEFFQNASEMAKDQVREAIRILRLKNPGAKDRKTLLRMYEPIRMQETEADWVLYAGGREYSIHHGRVRTENYPTVTNRDASSPPSMIVKNSALLSESDGEIGLRLLADASESRVLDFLGECGRCKKWFIGKRRRQRFCSGACQQAYWSDYRKTKKGLKYQRERLKRWRAKQKKSLKHRRIE